MLELLLRTVAPDLPDLDVVPEFLTVLLEDEPLLTLMLLSLRTFVVAEEFVLTELIWRPLRTVRPVLTPVPAVVFLPSPLTFVPRPPVVGVAVP